jgi:hypothetical protein
MFPAAGKLFHRVAAGAQSRFWQVDFNDRGQSWVTRMAAVSVDVRQDHFADG